MSINISGTVNFFVRYFGDGENRRQVFNTYVSREFGPEKGADRMSKSIDLTFDSKSFKKEDLAKLVEDVSYQMEVQEGFVTLKRYKRAGSNEWITDFVLHIKKAHLTKKTPVDQEKKAKALEEARLKKGGTPTPESPIDIDPDLPF